MTLRTWMLNNFDEIAGERIEDAMRLAKEDGVRVRGEAAMCAAFLREHARRANLRKRVRRAA